MRIVLWVVRLVLNRGAYVPVITVQIDHRVVTIIEIASERLNHALESDIVETEMRY
jgi:hypothetical protein